MIVILRVLLNVAAVTSAVLIAANPSNPLKYLGLTLACLVLAAYLPEMHGD